MDGGVLEFLRCGRLALPNRVTSEQPRHPGPIAQVSTAGLIDGSVGVPGTLPWS